MTWHDLRDSFVHLRLKSQLLLSPIFLLGFVVAGERPNWGLILGFVAFHIFGYGGGTAFNSVYDRDTGPIGGLEHPPAVPHHLLAFSISWQIVGFAIALGVNTLFAVVYAIMFWMSVAYSHPRTRLKGKPAAALATVALGQGVFPFVAGWVCARGDVASAYTPAGILGALAVTLNAVGFFPLTEIYQMDEDRARGDKTAAIWMGATGSFRFALVAIGLGGLAAVGLILVRFSLIEAVLVAGWVLLVLAFIWRWYFRFDPADVVGNFRRMMRLYGVTSMGFILWIGLHLGRWL